MFLFPTFSAFLASFKASISQFAVYSGYTLAAAGASGTVYYTVGTSHQDFTAYQGLNYAGVPGPDLAAGLPVLAVAVAYAAYRYLRNARAAA
jgi:hypothetical protein